MKNRVYAYVFIFMILSISSCTMSTNWEYKTISFSPKKITADDKSYKSGTDFFKNAVSSTSVDIDDLTLNKFGKEGWEIATSYLEMETVFPNLLASGNSVDGLQANVRPQRLVIVLKRPLKK